MPLTRLCHALGDHAAHLRWISRCPRTAALATLCTLNRNVVVVPITVQAGELLDDLGTVRQKCCPFSHRRLRDLADKANHAPQNAKGPGSQDTMQNWRNGKRLKRAIKHKFEQIPRNLLNSNPHFASMAQPIEKQTVS